MLGYLLRYGDEHKYYTYRFCVLYHILYSKTVERFGGALHFPTLDNTGGKVQYLIWLRQIR